MTEFPALLGRRSGVARLAVDRISFQADDYPEQIITIPYSNLEVEVSGLNSHHYILTDRLARENQIVVQDERVLQYLVDRGVAAAKKADDHSSDRKRKRALIVGSPVVFTLLLILAVPFMLSMIPIGWLGGMITHKQERAFGQLLLPAMIRGSELATEVPRPLKALRETMRTIQAANPRLRDLEFEVHLSNSPEMNAFALPGGIIVFNRGLLAKASTSEEIAGVMAHEMAHVERRHTLKAFAGRIGVFFGMLMVGTIIGTDAAVWIAHGSDLIALKHSRSTESEADSQAFHFLQTADIATDGLITFFDKLAAEEKLSLGGTSVALGFLSTHPLSEERVESLKALQSGTLKAPSPPFSIGLDEFKADF